MGFSFLVCLREGVEMALIVAILLGYLRTIGQKQHFKSIWMGVGVAAAICIAIGVALEIASREMDKRIVEAFEGFAMIFAVIVLTGMALWMKKQSRSIGSELRAQVDAALGKGSVTALVLLAATSVGREGLETVLFLFAGSTTSSGTTYILGGVLGFAVAAAIGAAIYAGSTRFPMKLFFQVSGIVIIVIAAGMLATSVVKLYEAAIISNLGSRPWDTESFIPMTSSLGKFLSTLVGYDSAPSMLQIGLYWTYLVAALSAFLFLPLGTPPAPKKAVAAVPENTTLATER
ncbi:MAG TPA: FTR1 family protein [Tepidiformaceae bacterium]|nr:FTR1 family protein [Tepidiformaceae bacterium]HNO66113.1 FTR1 family protein [Tepidiformaceae bacterium]